MAISDFQINSRIRGILAKHWIDINFITVTTIRGVVFLQGKLRKITATSASDEIGEETLATIEWEMKHIKGVRQIIYRLEDWRKDGGKFIKLSPSKKEEEEKKRIEPVKEKEED